MYRKPPIRQSILKQPGSQTVRHSWTSRQSDNQTLRQSDLARHSDSKAAGWKSDIRQHDGQTQTVRHESDSPALPDMRQSDGKTLSDMRQSDGKTSWNIKTDSQTGVKQTVRLVTGLKQPDSHTVRQVSDSQILSDMRRSDGKTGWNIKQAVRLV